MMCQYSSETTLDISLPRRHIDPQLGPYGAQYGASLVAARYCGYRKPPKRYKVGWQHGWIPVEKNIHPEFVVGGNGLSRQRKERDIFLVARKDQVLYLKRCGYSHVQAVGLPLVYLHKPRLTRVPGSLLVMPAHSLPETTEEWEGNRYATYIQKIAPRFSKVVVCIHSSCLDKGNWAAAFHKRGIPMISGADVRDNNSLLRMAILFSRFDFVTSNVLGSHIPYSAYFGAKPSIAGPRPHWHREHYQKSALYQNVPQLLDILERWYQENFWAHRYPEIHVSPWRARNLENWAAWQLGEQNKLSPTELCEQLDWPEPMSFGHVKLKLKRLRKYLSKMKERIIRV